MTAIVTKRLTLKSGLHDIDHDLTTMVRWLNDPDVVKYSEQRHKHHDIKTQHEYVANDSGIFRKIYAADAFIGTITAHVDENNSVANVGILIGEKTEWGKGYGTEAWQAFCDHLLANGIRKIEAGTMAVNTGMIRIFQKYRMIPEGMLAAHFLLDGHEIDCLQWARFK